MSPKAAALVAFAHRLLNPNLTYQEEYADFAELAYEQQGQTPTAASLRSAADEVEADIQGADAAIARMKAIRPPAALQATYARYLSGARDETLMWRDLERALRARTPSAFASWNQRSGRDADRDYNDQQAAGIFQIDMVSEYQRLKVSVPSWVTSIGPQS
jgi:hypothetical protein